MRQLPEALQAFAAYEQFILYKIVPDGDKARKLPVDHRTLQTFIKDCGWQQDPAAWTTADNAIQLAAMCGADHGVGFFFTVNDPFFFVDLDKCLQPDDSGWSPVAIDIMGRLPGAAVEVSHSGRGLHIFGTGNTPEHSCKNIPLGLELYTESRFVALTGTNIVGSAATDCTSILPALVAGYFPPKVATKSQEWTSTPAEGSTPPETDEELINRGLASGSAESVFAGKASFKSLWNCDVDVLAATYPDGSGTRAYDESTADMALVQHLCFWTGNNCERVLKLMWLSGLVRDKWTSHAQYLHMTITRAASMQNSFYTVGKKKEERPRIDVAPTVRTLDGPTRREGFQFLGIDGQVELFNGCIYIQDIHRVFTPDGGFLKAEQFNATYGGYVFQVEDNASGKTTKKAWEAFTESQGVQYPLAHSSCFRPSLDVGALIQDEGRVMVNTYIPVITQRQQGDAGPFLDHLQRVLPVPGDRAILLAYMAACVQYKGVKFQWAPLIQGAEGNGKTLFTLCVAAALGDRYTHLPPANEIAEKFNEWLFNKLFIGVEDVYVPDHKQEIIEVIKPMITNKRLAMRAMQQSQVMGDNCANFILNSNHRDAIRKTRNDRRFCVFYTAQQCAEDIIKDGMNGDYFPSLYRWLDGGGYAIVTDYLYTYTIPDQLNPAGACHRAPETSSTNEAIQASMGGVEQEILEAIDEGRPGFAGGWVSSMAIERLLQAQRLARAIPHNKRRELMKSLGYDYHPALNNGRVNNLVAFDGGKPRLFIRDGHISANLISAAEVARAYQEAQGAMGGAVGVNAAEAFKS